MTRAYVLQRQPGGEWALIENATGLVVSRGTGAGRKAPLSLKTEQAELEAQAKKTPTPNTHPGDHHHDHHQDS